MGTAPSPRKVGLKQLFWAEPDLTSVEEKGGTIPRVPLFLEACRGKRGITGLVRHCPSAKQRLAGFDLRLPHVFGLTRVKCRLAWPHHCRELASDGVRADARSSVSRRVRSVAKRRLGWHGGVFVLLQQRSRLKTPTRNGYDA